MIQEQEVKQLESMPQGYKMFMFNSAEREISNDHEYKNIKKFSFFQTQINRDCYFSCSLMLNANS